MLMKRFLATIAFLAVCLFTNCNGKSYKDHSLVHATPKDEAELDFFKKLDDYYKVNFWRKPGLVNRPVEFSISRNNLAELIRDTKDMSIDFFTVIRDLQSAFDNQTVKVYIRRRMDTYDWRNYYSVDDIYSWLKDLSELHPEEVTLQTFGQSVEGRNLLAVRVTLGERTGRTRFKVIVEGGCHAREWISPAFVTYMINEIVNAKNTTDTELRKIAFAYDWIFIPLFNPDGYAFSQTQDRLWRKNVHTTYGVDLNRNFGIAFGKHGASTKKQDEDYCGRAPFSEPETSALSTFVRENSRDLLYYLSIHAYGQFLVIPYAFEKVHLENFDDVKKKTDKAARRSKNNFRISYATGTAFDTVGYFASGISTDWVKKSLDVPYVIAIELPDQGQDGFALPPSKILRTCEASMDMLLEFFSPPPKNDTVIVRKLEGNGVAPSKPKFRTIFFVNVVVFSLKKIYCVY